MPAWVPQRAHRAGGKRNAHSCSLPLLPLQTVVPSFNLYRGLYELSQYAFLADRTGSAGLTWARQLCPGGAVLHPASLLLGAGVCEEGGGLQWRGAVRVEGWR